MGRIRRIYTPSWVIGQSRAQSTAGSQREEFFMQAGLRRPMTLGQMAPRMSPARSAGSSLIWQNPKSTLHHLPQRHLRLPIASTLGSGF